MSVRLPGKRRVVRTSAEGDVEHVVALDADLAYLAMYMTLRRLVQAVDEKLPSDLLDAAMVQARVALKNAATS